MYVVASFKLNKNLERVIAELEYLDISRKNILALPLAKTVEQETQTSYHQRSFEIMPILGTIIMLFGTIYGFVLQWGPILWGLIGLGIGVLIGGVIDLLRIKRTRKKGIHKQNDTLTEVFLLVHCSNKDQAHQVKGVIWKWSPAGVATYKNQTEGSSNDHD
ncbi:hypothetical protein KFZ58_17625 [Virgibacillus sp. NKC19-16]|uniref:hypothetical protein n=1 Tax=Virgibacillus salidurans TaxID=2831673 RepID=UPI001F370D65|nr:hypothetical protein [Virgibacillus sp. NKC19-16]UJL46154.1 hypothetical protein KFZ58_17625 [Virgibacillus sp. NKC19-16]